VFQGRTIGDFAQLGGAMIIDIDGTIIWSHMSKDASDIASAAEILAALRAVTYRARTSRRPLPASFSLRRPRL
jgi:predicted regulator of Ras-like GTPase activity (Roadblock/LC7/MglB family)